MFVRGGAAVLGWSHDADGDPTTLTDTAIYTATWDGADWSAAGPLAGAGDGVADLWPRLAYDGAGRLNLVWVKQRVPQSAELDDVVDRLYFVEYDGGAVSSQYVGASAILRIDVVAPLGRHKTCPYPELLRGYVGPGRSPSWPWRR